MGKVRSKKKMGSSGQSGDGSRRARTSEDSGCAGQNRSSFARWTAEGGCPHMVRYLTAAGSPHGSLLELTGYAASVCKASGPGRFSLSERSWSICRKSSVTRCGSDSTIAISANSRHRSRWFSDIDISRLPEGWDLEQAPKSATARGSHVQSQNGVGLHTPAPEAIRYIQ